MIVGPRYNDVDPAVEAAYQRAADAETASRIDAIAARLEAATKGPWEPTASLYPDGTYHDHVTAEWDIEVDICEVPRTPQGSADADLIAHAPADLAALLAFARDVAVSIDSVDTETNEAQQAWLVGEIRAALNRLAETP